MGGNIEYVDKKIEQKDNKKELLESRKGLTDSKGIEEGRKLGFKKKSSNRKGDEIMDRKKILLNNYIYNKNKKQ